MSSETQALRWIVELLQRLDVPFQAAGGLAARAYGARRPLLDFDFYVLDSRLAEIAAAAAAHVVRPPAPYQDSSWHLWFMKLEYGGCEIELAGANGAQFYDARTEAWCDAAIDFEHSVERTVLGVTMPTMPLQQLLGYKRALGRDVDHADVTEIARANSRRAG